MFQLYKKNWDLHTRAGVTRFSTLFCSLKDSTYCTVCPVWTGKNDLVKFFVFCEDIQSQNRVRLVVDNADTLSKLSETTPTPCLRSHWLRWNRVRVVNEYFTKCPRSQRLRLHKFFANIFAKMKKFAKPFLPVHPGPRSKLLSKKGSKTCDTVPLKESLT